MTPQSAQVIPLVERLGPVAWAVHHRLSMPDPGQPALAEWWHPLVCFSRRVRQERVPWPVHPDEFEFVGWVRRDRRPSLSLYRHVDSPSSELAIGPTGLPHRFVWVAGPAGGRFVECDVRQAIWTASLPRLVEPVWYDEIDPVHAVPDDPPPVAARRHLRLV